MKRVYANEQWCVDCGRCEVACKVAHSTYRNVVKTYVLESDTTFSRIHLQGDAAVSFAMNCRHCDHPRCVEGCISGALRKDAASGFVLVDETRCVGCRTCMSACPYGCIEVHVLPGRGKGLAFKCDLCEQNGALGTPACVEVCPNRALIVLDDAEEAR